MKIRIKGQDVVFEDEKMTTIFLTTEQLLELVRTINVSMDEDGGLIFEVLEFTV